MSLAFLVHDEASGQVAQKLRIDGQRFAPLEEHWLRPKIGEVLTGYL